MIETIAYKLYSKEKELTYINEKIAKLREKIEDMDDDKLGSRKHYRMSAQLSALVSIKVNLEYEIKKYRLERGMINPDMLMDGTRLLYKLRHGFCEEQAGCAYCPANIELDDCAGDCIFEMASYVLEDRLKSFK